MTTSVLVVKVVNYTSPKAEEELLIVDLLVLQERGPAIAGAAGGGQPTAEGPVDAGSCLLPAGSHSALRCLPREGLCAWLSPSALALLVARELLHCLIFSPLQSVV